MICPKCKSESLRVVEKRDIENEPAIRRRRECTDCNFRFTTYERLEVPTLTIRKNDGHTEVYSREKLAAGIYRALEKRPVTEPKVESLIEKIEKELHATGVSEISSEKVGDLVMQNLLKTDEVAYLRFASVYKKFESLEAFKQELTKISK
jgi:transcriptional repressor NrdR